MKALSQPLFASLRGYDRAQLGPDLFSGALIALLLGSLAHAESPLPLEVAHPEKLAADNPVQTVGGIISDSLGTPTSTPLPVNVPAMPEEQKLLLQMTQREQGKVSPS